MLEAAVGTPTNPSTASRLPPVDSLAAALPCSAASVDTATLLPARARMWPLRVVALRRAVADGQRPTWRARGRSVAVSLDCFSLEFCGIFCSTVRWGLFRQGASRLCSEAEPDGGKRISQRS